MSYASSYPVLTPDQLGAVLQATRKAQQRTQAEMSLHLGLSQPRVSYLERHTEEISVKQLLAWCAALSLELSLGSRTQPEVVSASTEW